MDDPLFTWATPTAIILSGFLMTYLGMFVQVAIVDRILHRR